MGFAFQEIANPESLEHLNENFNVELPFRGCDLAFESEVSGNCWAKYAYHNLIFNYSHKNQGYKELAGEIRRFYFGEDAHIDGNKLTEYIDMMSDVFFFRHIDMATRLLANASTGKTFYFR